MRHRRRSTSTRRSARPSRTGGAQRPSATRRAWTRSSRRTPSWSASPAGSTSRGSVLVARGRPAVQLADTNAIYRLDPDVGKVTVFRSKSGYTGVDIAATRSPGRTGSRSAPTALALRGNRRLARVNPHGDITVLATLRRKRLNSPTTRLPLDGTLLFHDPPFGLPDVFDDPDRSSS